MGKAKDMSAEMLRQRSKGPFGDRPLPCSKSGMFGPTKEEWRGLYRTMDLIAVMIGKWTKEEVLFLLKNKKNAICPKGDALTVLYCPSERRDELIQILHEEFGMLLFGGDDERRFIAVRGNGGIHILRVHDDGNCDFLMHYR